ncbi:hypothetical protein DMA11_20730 [Marinilabiliaceae bacterium JC017]|nr:hypothetical protein DMA11_20730 [Marinilabiliaceae bacterium JC017]
MTFIINGMTCNGCEKTIEAAVGRLEGIFSVKANYQMGNTIITFDTTQVSKETIANTISNLGYEVR